MTMRVAVGSSLPASRNNGSNWGNTNVNMKAIESEPRLQESGEIVTRDREIPCRKLSDPPEIIRDPRLEPSRPKLTGEDRQVSNGLELRQHRRLGGGHHLAADHGSRGIDRSV